MKKLTKSLVTIFRLSWGTGLDWERREEWFLSRTEGMTYKSTLKGEEAAEEAFHITNAPEDYLTDEQKLILEEQNFKGPSLSVGDVVRVSPILRKGNSEFYICKSIGWEKFTGDYFHLLRHLG